VQTITSKYIPIVHHWLTTTNSIVHNAPLGPFSISAWRTKVTFGEKEGRMGRLSCETQDPTIWTPTARLSSLPLLAPAGRLATVRK
jgi:hypothetical protein